MPPPDYSIQTEVEAILRTADAGFETYEAWLAAALTGELRGDEPIPV